jgi:TorA maturation chaperone TorD
MALMRDRGLSEAIQAAGGVTELARRVGLAQPSVSNWDKIPAERVLVVEAATGVGRKVLRPDLYGEREATARTVDDVDVARAQEYALLSTLLVRAPDTALLQRLSALRGDATPLGVAHVELAEAAAKASVQRVEREYFDLFIGLGRGELLPYGSFYIAGFLHERPLARLREDLRAFGIQRVEGNYEPEDHAATLCEIMAGLVNRKLPAPDGAEQRIFEKHLLPWIGRFFADLERANAANFYRNVGTLGRVFIEIEKEAFALPS